MKIDAPAKLARWLRDHRMRPATLAEMLEITRQAVDQYLSRDCLPGRKTAAKIERATGIPCWAWDGQVPIILHPTGCMCAECRRGMEGR